jgi:CubicO group peptidase (beta-lactamase class C family)
MRPTADAADLGFDPSRLARVDKHLAAYVDDGRLAGWELALTRGDEVAHVATYGWRDREADIQVDGNTLWRIASMTKPITAVVAMSLWEEGLFDLTDPISKWLPAYSDVRVYESGSAAEPRTVPAREPIRVWHLLSHSSGLSAGFIRAHVVDELYRNAGFDLGAPAGATLASCVDDWARLPLRFEPGTAWGYGVSTDVLGRLIEIWTGQRLDQAVAARLTVPLGMNDTVWHADPTRVSRLGSIYVRDPESGRATVHELLGTMGRQEPNVFSGGGGMLSTLPDYTRFTRMLAGGGTYDGVRILAPATVRLMTANHLPGDLAQLSTGGFAETTFDGVGFGLGFATVVDPTLLRTSGSRGEFFWGGVMSTVFWVDPATGVTCTFMTQLFPSYTYPIRRQLRQLVYAALVR